MALPDYRMNTLARFAGREIGVSGWTTVDQARIDAFADCTGDRQWIHVDVERARRESPFGGTIAHGYLTLSLAASLVDRGGRDPGDAGAALNYGLDKVRIPRTGRADARVRNRIVLLEVEPKQAAALLRFRTRSRSTARTSRRSSPNRWRC